MPRSDEDRVSCSGAVSPGRLHRDQQGAGGEGLQYAWHSETMDLVSPARSEFDPSFPFIGPGGTNGVQGYVSMTTLSLR